MGLACRVDDLIGSIRQGKVIDQLFIDAGRTKWSHEDDNGLFIRIQSQIFDHVFIFLYFICFGRLRIAQDGNIGVFELLEVFFVRADDQIDFFVQHAVCPADKGVLFMDHRFQMQGDCRLHDRNGNVIAETDRHVIVL